MDINSPDWGRWEAENTRPYLTRLLSQAIWQMGAVVDRGGADLRDRLWGLADRLLEAAHPMPDPVEIDLGGDSDGV